jgi:MoxR-like ATPase
LLEAMEERQVTVDGESWPLPAPHLVLATQNPVDQAGTFPLVESQMDRFLLATRLGYPDEETETKLALSHGAQPSLSSLSPTCTPAGLAAAQAAVADLPVAPTVAAYAVAVVRATRADPAIRLGASPRAAIGLVAAARAHAVIAGRRFVLPDDVKAVAVSVLAHRLVTDTASVGTFDAGIAAMQAILERVPAPRP